MKHHLGAGNAAIEIDTRNDVERRHRIARRRDDIEGREYVGDDLVAPINRDRWRRPLLRPEPLGARIDHRHHAGRQTFAQLALFRVGGRCEGECEKSEPREIEKGEAA